MDLTFVFMASRRCFAFERLGTLDPLDCITNCPQYYPLHPGYSQVSLLSPIEGFLWTISEYKDMTLLLVVCPTNRSNERAPGKNLTVREKYIFAGYYATPEVVVILFNKQGAQAYPRPLSIPR